MRAFARPVPTKRDALTQEEERRRHDGSTTVSDSRQRTSGPAVARMVLWIDHHQSRTGRGAALWPAARSSRAPRRADQNTRPGVTAAGGEPGGHGQEGEHPMSLTTFPAECDVLVVGAGPVGLTLASELTRHGVSCRLIDKAQQAAPWSRAAGIQARTLELFEKMGVVDTFLTQGNKAKGLSVSSHEKELAHFDFPQLIDSPYPYALLIPQHITETILAEHLTNHQGLAIERGVELISLIQ